MFQITPTSAPKSVRRSRISPTSASILFSTVKGHFLCQVEAPPDSDYLNLLRHLSFSVFNVRHFQTYLSFLSVGPFDQIMRQNLSFLLLKGLVMRKSTANYRVFLKRVLQRQLSYFGCGSRISLFHMFFGIRILSPFHLSQCVRKFS